MKRSVGARWAEMIGEGLMDSPRCFLLLNPDGPEMVQLHLATTLVFTLLMDFNVSAFPNAERSVPSLRHCA